jgi:hypothetical protein
MLNKILVVGCKGSMGKRYCAILDYLGIDYEGVDLNDKPTKSYNAVILATPTDMHIDDLEFFLPDVPVLCEKPISKSFGAARTICAMALEKGWDLRMVNQYEYLTSPRSDNGPTLYDYYRSGNDGLEFDCYNIIGLAEGRVSLRNKSPIWTCAINGQILRLSDMDGAYVKMIRSWLSGEVNNITYILKANDKVRAYIEAHE